MDTNRIRQFCVIAELENIRKTSELLHITHSALSKSMKVLELEINKNLFHKVGRGISLTDEGKVFYQKAKIFLKAVDQLLDNKENTANIIRIATFEVFSTYFFNQKIFPKFKKESFSIKEATPGKLEQLILTQKADIGITYQPIPTQGLEIIKAGTCKIGIFSNNKKFNKQNFNQIPFVAPVTDVETTISEVRGLDGWPDHQIKRNIKYRVDMLETALQLCSQGLACGYFPQFVAEMFNQTRIKTKQLYKIDSPIKLKNHRKEIFIVKRKSSESKKLIEKLQEIINEIE